jgi:hypothetical protein
LWFTVASLAAGGSSGQRINISLLDFTASVSERETVNRRQYGFIVEKTSKKNVSIYAATTGVATKSQRESHVYTSDTNDVNIMLIIGTQQTSTNYNFLVKLNGMHYSRSPEYNTCDGGGRRDIHIYYTALSGEVPPCLLCDGIVQMEQ